jgi:hypothetical protein
MGNFTKTVRIGTTKHGDTYCAIQFNDGRLSLTGVEGPMRSGNAHGSCGQITLNPDAFSEFAPGWDRATLERFISVWETWHLNDMQAGTPAQTAELKKHTFPGYPVSHYDWARDVLRESGLNPDNGYNYGSAWLRVDVPEDVLAFLRSLPESDRTPAWV